jgi:hypothetical protein
MPVMSEQLPSTIAQGRAADPRLTDPIEHAYCIKAGAAVKRYRETSRLSWRDWTKLIGPAMVMCRKKAQERMGKFGRRYEEHMNVLIDYYGLEDITGNDRSALLYIMDHLDEVNEWRDKQYGRDNLNNPQVVLRGMRKSARGFDNALESRDTILCKCVVLLADTVRQMLAEIARLKEEFEWEKADPREGAPRAVQSSLHHVCPEVEFILERIHTVDDAKAFLRKKIREEEEQSND